MNNYLIDTHCHLQDEKYDDVNIDELIQRAVDNNVKKIIVSGYDEKSNLFAVKMANKYPEVYATVGYQPLELNHINDKDLIQLENLLNKPKVVAIGEIGLDYHYEDTNKELQNEMFIKQLQLANEHNIPVVIHSRDCINETYEIIKEYKNQTIKGVIHCYAGSYEMAEKFKELNLYFGIGGTLTYKSNEKTKEVIKKLSLDCILLETDSPYLTPEPKRKEINEPSNVVYVAEKIAEIKNISIAEVTSQTTKNAITLFDI